MKKIVILLAFLSILTCIKAQETIKWMSIQEAEELNKTAPRKYFIDVYTDWCGWCKRMDMSTFKNPAVVKYLNENYYCVKFNAESTEKINFNGMTFLPGKPKANSRTQPVHGLASALLQGRMAYPSYSFMSSNNELIYILPGFQEVDILLDYLDFIAKDYYLTMTMEEYQLSISKNK